MKKFIALVMLMMCNSAYSSTLDAPEAEMWDTEEAKQAWKQEFNQWKTEKIGIHKTRCAKIKEKLEQCIHDKNYKGKFTISIINPRVEEWDDFYAEIINGTGDKTTLTDEEIKSMHDNIYSYITGTGLNGIMDIFYEGKQLFEGWWTTTGY